MVIDQLLSMGVLSWNFRLEQPGFAILFIGLGFVAVHHFLVNERMLHSIEQEIEIAQRIQKSNLPASINFPQNIDIAARYVPMSRVAGDFYDIQTIDETGVGLVIADVSGHGVGAALIGSMLKICFASQVHYIADPARVLIEINRTLQGKIETSFITACSLFIDFENEIIRYSIAGHPPPILLRKSNSEIIKLNHASTIIGPFPNTIYENATLNIVKDDRLVLFTDGITEANNKSGELFGEDRLEALIKVSSTYSVDRAADLIIEQISDWSGRSHKTSFDDDLTLIIIDAFSKK